MWTCTVCSRQIEDEETFCYHCGAPAPPERGQTARVSTAEEAVVARARRLDKVLPCPRCQTKMRYAGLKRFHEGSRGWGFWLGDLSELFVNREEFDVYLCPKCGKAELFVDGIGEEYRTEQQEE